MNDDEAMLPNEVLMMRLQRVTTGANIHRVANLRQSYIGSIEMATRLAQAGKLDQLHIDAVLAAELKIEAYIQTQS